MHPLWSYPGHIPSIHNHCWTKQKGGRAQGGLMCLHCSHYLTNTNNQDERWKMWRWKLLGEEKIAWNDWLLFLSSKKTFVNETFDDNNEKYDRKFEIFDDNNGSFDNNNNRCDRKFEIFDDNNESRRKVETDLRDCRWDQPQIGRSLSRNKRTGESTSFIRQQKSSKLLFLRTKLFEIFSSIKNEKKVFLNQPNFFQYCHLWTKFTSDKQRSPDSLISPIGKINRRVFQGELRLDF